MLTSLFLNFNVFCKLLTVFLLLQFLPGPINLDVLLVGLSADVAPNNACVELYLADLAPDLIGGVVSALDDVRGEKRAIARPDLLTGLVHRGSLRVLRFLVCVIVIPN